MEAVLYVYVSMELPPNIQTKLSLDNVSDMGNDFRNALPSRNTLLTDASVLKIFLH